MIDPVSSSASVYAALRSTPGVDGQPAGPVRAPDNSGIADSATLAPDSVKPAGSFGDLIGGLVRSVDDRTKIAEAETRKLMLGESDNLHRSMIAMQEAGLAFNLLVEVRNKLVESYQELMRMPV